jgi:RNA polymerase sigma factor (sigma-70 family)
MTRAEFNDYVKLQSRKLYGFAFRILRNQEEAEDAVQEVFIKLWKMKERLGEYNSIDALATTMMKNHCIDHLRRASKLFTDDIETSKGNFIQTSVPSPNEQMELSETNEILHSIIGRLPDAQKIIIVLRDIEGWSYEEISEKTEQNINTLRVTLSRARKLIRDEFNKYTNERRGN